MSGLYDGLLPPSTSEKYSSVPPPPSGLATTTTPTSSASTSAATPSASSAKPAAPPASANAWSSNAKFLAAVNLRKKAAAASHPPKPVPKKAGSFTPAAVSMPVTQSDPLHSDKHDEDINDEYEPSKPNDYEDYLTYRSRKRSEPDDDNRPEERFSLKSLEEKYKNSLLPGGDFGSRMMKKMGWQEGQGLGKTAADAERKGSSGFGSDSYKLGKIISAPSRVVLLQNMVGRGEVDPTLEAETIDECLRFGSVDCCAVREQPIGVPEEDAVQIFVKFSDRASAEKAVADLGGRFFGGRQVQAHFYDERTFTVEFPNK